MGTMEVMRKARACFLPKYASQCWFSSGLLLGQRIIHDFLTCHFFPEVKGSSVAQSFHVMEKLWSECFYMISFQLKLELHLHQILVKYLHK